MEREAALQTCGFEHFVAELRLKNSLRKDAKA
jgi:hypothetical protein